MKIENPISLKAFESEMKQVDALVHVLLKGHLLIEEALSRIIEQYVFHAEHLREARLTFNQKLLVARALCLRKARLGEWELLTALNKLRNEIAHKLQSGERDKKVGRVKALYFREAPLGSELSRAKKLPDETIILNACAHCYGFLGRFLTDSRSFRGIIHSLDRGLNPNLPPFDL